MVFAVDRRVHATPASYSPSMDVRGALLFFACLCACGIPFRGCGEEADIAQLALYEDPHGLFSLMLAVDWEIAPEVSEWRLFAGEPS